MATVEEKNAIGRAIAAAAPYPVVVELGAHCGEDGAWLEPLCQPWPGRYVMVEPDPRNAQYLIDNPRRPVVDFRRLVLGAVSDQDGIAEFHFCRNERDKNRASGSLRKPTGHREHFPWIEFPFVGSVPTYRLDTLFEREQLARIDLLWVDIQGAEREMILGGETALRHTRFAFLEVEDVELYEGEALRPELVALMAERGFSEAENFGYNMLFRNVGFEECVR